MSNFNRLSWPCQRRATGPIHTGCRDPVKVPCGLLAGHEGECQPLDAHLVIMERVEEWMKNPPADPSLLKHAITVELTRAFALGYLMAGGEQLGISWL